MTQPTRVLLVEDNEIDKIDVERILLQKLEETYELTWVQRLSDALKDDVKFGPFDICLVDLNLPDCQGITTLEKMVSTFKTLPIVVLTGNEDPRLGKECVRAGAQDYISKDLLSPELLSRTIMHARERMARQITERELVAMHTEMMTARGIAARLIPEEIPTIEGVDVGTCCVPANAVGGDFFDFFKIADGNLAVIVADVSDHGLGPALIMAGTRRVIRTLGHIGKSVSEIFEVANKAVFEDTRPYQFVTGFCASFDFRAMRMRYVAAGHKAYVIHADGELNVLESTALPMGLFESVAYPESETVTLEPGDIFFAITDGFEEARNRNHQMYGEEAVLDFIREHREKAAQNILNNLLNEVFTHSMPKKPHDDMTAVLLKFGTG